MSFKEYPLGSVGQRPLIPINYTVLPAEIYLYIFSLLPPDPTTLLTIGKVCKYFNSIVSDNLLWEPIAHHWGISVKPEGDDKVSYRRLVYEKEKQEFSQFIDKGVISFLEKLRLEQHERKELELLKKVKWAEKEIQSIKEASVEEIKQYKVTELKFEILKMSREIFRINQRTVSEYYEPEAEALELEMIEVQKTLSQLLSEDSQGIEEVRTQRLKKAEYFQHLREDYDKLHQEIVQLVHQTRQSLVKTCRGTDLFSEERKQRLCTLLETAVLELIGENPEKKSFLEKIFYLKKVRLEKEKAQVRFLILASAKAHRLLMALYHEGKAQKPTKKICKEFNIYPFLRAVDNEDSEMFAIFSQLTLKPNSKELAVLSNKASASVEKGDREYLELLIKAGAPIDSLRYKEISIWVPKNSDYQKTLELLLKNNAFIAGDQFLYALRQLPKRENDWRGGRYPPNRTLFASLCQNLANSKKVPSGWRHIKDDAKLRAKSLDDKKTRLEEQLTKAEQEGSIDQIKKIRSELDQYPKNGFLQLMVDAGLYPELEQKAAKAEDG